jgi:hypothetical protein
MFIKNIQNNNSFIVMKKENSELFDYISPSNIINLYDTRASISSFINPYPSYLNTFILSFLLLKDSYVFLVKSHLMDFNLLNDFSYGMIPIDHYKKIAFQILKEEVESRKKQEKPPMLMVVQTKDINKEFEQYLKMNMSVFKNLQIYIIIIKYEQLGFYIKSKNLELIASVDGDSSNTIGLKQTSILCNSTGYHVNGLLKSTPYNYNQINEHLKIYLNTFFSLNTFFLDDNIDKQLREDVLDNIFALLNDEVVVKNYNLNSIFLNKAILTKFYYTMITKNITSKHFINYCNKKIDLALLVKLQMDSNQ